MSRSALLVCAALCISCAGSHANGEPGNGSDAAADVLDDASIQAPADAAADGAPQDASADAAKLAVDDGDATVADAAQVIHDGRDGGPSPGTCRQEADCPTGSSCRPPDYVAPPCRGIACRSDLAPGCSRNSDCGTNSRCHVFQDVVCSGEYYRSCAAPCSTDIDCMGTSCQADGTCLPAKHCSLTQTCPTHFHCDALLGNPETGCVRDSCRSDTECDGGVCLFEECSASVGVCRPHVGPCLAP